MAQAAEKGDRHLAFMSLKKALIFPIASGRPAVVYCEHMVKRIDGSLR